MTATWQMQKKKVIEKIKRKLKGICVCEREFKEEIKGDRPSYTSGQIRWYMGLTVPTRRHIHMRH